MKNFTYIQPKDLKEASKALGKDWKGSLLFAGGTDLLGLMKDGIENPDILVNLKSVPDLKSIEYAQGIGLQIGALVTINEIAEHELIQKKYTVLAQAAREIASPQLRNMGTLGGNLCQRPRCWYYRGEFDCLRKGGGTCFAVEGRNKYHCVIGGGLCFIIHPSDTAVALTALNATIVVSSGKKSRQVPIRDFFILPDENVERENILKPGEIVTAVQIPDLPETTISAYTKFKERAVWDFAVVSAAVVLNKNSSTIHSGSIALGGVAPKPWIEKNVDAKLSGMAISEENIRQISNAALTEAEPFESNQYKIQLVRNIITRMLTDLCFT